MPRDSSGNYTLPLGNPVIDGTIIDTNWANPTMSDIAVQLNNVVTRDGLLSPISPMYFVDGTPALPGIAFAAAHGTGFWRSATQIGVSWQGVTKQTWSATGTSLTGTISSTGIISSDAGFNGTPDLILMSSGTEKARINAAGNVAIGVAPAVTQTLRVGKAMTGATTVFGIVSNGAVQADVTVAAYNFYSAPTTVAAAFVLPNLYQFFAAQGTIGAGSAITNQHGFHAASSLIGAVNNYGFFGGIPAAAGRWNLYMAGSADNYINGKTLYGSDVSVSSRFGAAANLSPNFQINSLIGTSQSINRFTADGTGPYVFIGKSRSAAVGAFAIVSTNDNLGQIVFNGSDGVEMQEAARIAVVVSGIPAAGSVGGSLILGTSPGAGGALNRMIVSNIGDITSNVNVAVPALAVNNTMVFNLTTNTNLRVSVRGTDGVTRVANIALA